ncbi:hybrid sensor histidine kinase/response regulator [Oceanicoccus sp. KOV_DT_Chl]|uniref:hybrid sensor histidine kinase/response regulator n=1 Tax=Oceanicoccus sp. KOV_DT_Chl TaxID=1904639 RepID=UPI000C7D0C35|nr:HAMP domain-containing sensor histidine kinase [Oceanicoccus sp. KOV_DT_Chl]
MSAIHLMTAKPANEQKIYNAQIEIIYQTIPIHLFTSGSVSLLVAWAVWSQENSLGLTLWLIAGAISIGLRYWSYRAFNMTQHEPLQPLTKWAWLALLQLLVYGFMWGMMPVFFVDLAKDDTAKIIVAYFFTAFIMIGQAVTYSSYKPMWFAYALPATGSMITMLLLHDAADSNLWALYLLMLVLFCISSLQKNHRSIVEVIKLKLEYADLMQQLQQEKEKADRANQSKSTFLASASHDLRQPVHAMNLFIEMLKKKTLPSDATLLIDRIAVSATSLQGLFNSLLDISSLDAGTIEVNNKATNIATLIADLIALNTPEAEKKGLQLRADTDDVNIITDPVLLLRILSNLLTNAINHTDQGSIAVKAKTTDQWVTISITDTGKGIAAKNITHIFDEFSQLHNPERDRNKGLGLGLAICKRLAQLLETDITVSSQEGQGSTFSIKLSLANNTEKIAYDDASVDEEFWIGNVSIMIVDDEKDIREAMPMLLESWGCQQAIAVSDIKEAENAINGALSQTC